MSLQKDRNNVLRDRTGPQSSWPVSLSALKSPPEWFSNTVCVLLGLAAIYLAFLALVAVGRLTLDLLGNDRQAASDAVKSLLPITAAAVGLPLIVWRLVILNHQTRISETKTQIDRETQYTSIFSRSVEQLGQTREIKESREKDGAIETITRTVPNIEVRLGGIHSLARLAEESARDVEKIENTLRSYVRENSWSDRDGITIKPAFRPSLSTFNWAYHYRKGDLGEEANSALQKWVDQSKTASEEQLKWSKPARETRVDVNEAIDVVATAANASRRKSENRFYECLFVGRLFRSEVVAMSLFERCTFVRCRFNVEKSIKLRCAASNLIDCRISGVDSNIQLINCMGVQLAISGAENARLELISSQIYDFTILKSNRLTLSLSHAAVHKGWINPGDGLLFNGDYADIAGCSFREVEFSSASAFKNCAFADVNLFACDLSAVEDISEQVLQQMKADPAVRHPTTMTRPSSWPAFDPEYKDDLSF
jgi:hypothetical protein